MQEVFDKIIEKIKTDPYTKLYGSRNSGNYMIPVDKAIEIVKQAAAEYNNGWFPCSERLPEDKQTCLVTARIYFTPDHVDEIDNYIGVGIDTYSKQFGWLGTEPIAWQPLPAPYQPKGE